MSDAGVPSPGNECCGLHNPSGSPISKTSTAAPWPHAPPHWLFSPGIYFITASTYHRQPIFDTPEKLSAVTRLLFETSKTFGWTLRAWAVMRTHYHVLAESPQASGESLRRWLNDFHRTAAMQVNTLSNSPGRRVWMNFRETHITHQTSYLARLHYVNENPVHHGLARLSAHYPWCSAPWFETNAPRSFVESVARFKTNKIHVWDDFDG